MRAFSIRLSVVFYTRRSNHKISRKHVRLLLRFLHSLRYIEFFIKSSVCDYDNIALNIETVLIFLLVC